MNRPSPSFDWLGTRLEQRPALPAAIMAGPHTRRYALEEREPGATQSSNRKDRKGRQVN